MIEKLRKKRYFFSSRNKNKSKKTRNKKNKMGENLDDKFELFRDYLRFLNSEAEIQTVETLLSDLIEHFKSESEDLDSTDEVLDTVQNIAESAQEEFEELIGAVTDKKIFLRKLSILIAILLNTNYNTAEKSKEF